MKLLLDENLPKRLKKDLLPHQIWTVREMGWNGKSNGLLLDLMKENGIDVLLTFDKRLQYQQNFTKYDVPVIVLVAEDNTYATLAPKMNKVMKLLDAGIAAGPNVIE